MQVRREGKLKNSDLRTGDTLSIELFERDIEELIDPRRRYTMARFMEFRHTGLGWAPEDKLHINLERPFEPEDAEQLANLSLDPGGDLYFTIWEGEPLRQARAGEEFRDLNTLVTSDPSNTLQRLGIRAVTFYNLNRLSRALGLGDLEF